MAALQFPCTIFKTKKWMDDYNASDMRYGDLTATQLKTHYHLDYISDQVDPYTLTRRSAMNRPQSMFCCNLRGQEEKLTQQQCANILFDEFRTLSRQFSLYGPYKNLIVRMITHMQNRNGAPFRDASLDRALKDQIINDQSDNSSKFRLKKALSKNIDWKNKIFPHASKEQLYEAVSSGRLPKFDRFQDNINGMGITVHDTWATHIKLKSLHIDNKKYHAVINYKIQDHFGLDANDIFNKKFSQFHLFRIWFVLQHYNHFAFKPFITNLESTIEISGEKDES